MQDSDIAIDSGNPCSRDGTIRAGRPTARAVHYLGASVSCGVYGPERGWRLLVGGEHGPVRQLEPVFATPTHHK